MDEILPSDPSIYWTVFTAVVRRNLKVRPLKWKLLRALPSCGTVLLGYKLKVDLRFESANNRIRWDPLDGSYWVTFLRVVCRRVGGLRQVDKGRSCASSSSFTLSTLYRFYIDPLSTLHEPTSALHWPHMDPTSPAHWPTWFLPILRFTLRFSMKIQNKLKRTKRFGILGRIGWSQNFRYFGIKIVQNPQVWKGLLC